MRIPIKILLGDYSFLDPGITWGDIINTWETYAKVWNQADLMAVDPNEAPVLDMFGDEGITIKSVVKDLSDPKKLFTDFSRSFTVPASKKNNRIFKHYYNIDIKNGLDSRELINATIIMNNVTYKVGNLRVDGVRMRNGIAQNYKLTFIGKLSELSRNIGKDNINGLDFTDLDNNNFIYQAELQNDTKRDLMFPIASRSTRFLAHSNQKSLGIEGAQNIAWVDNGAALDYGIREQDVVGALSVGAILDKIQSKYNFNFTGVLEADYIRDLYLWLHQTDKKREGETIDAIAENFAWHTTAGNPNSNFKPVQNGFVFEPTDETREIGNKRRFHVTVRGVFPGSATIKLMVNNNVIREVSVSGEYTETLIIYGYNSDIIYQVKVESDNPAVVDLIVAITQYDKIPGTYGNLLYWSLVNQSFITAQAVTGGALTYSVSQNMPEMTIMDFLSSLFKMFNIVAVVDSQLNISTKHFDHFMSEGEVKDFTKWIDVEQYDINRPNLYSGLTMKFEDPKLALEVGYKAVNGRNYGSLDYDLTGKSGVKLSGSDYVMEVKNQRSPIEPLDDLNTNDDFRVCYTLFSDVSGTEQSIKPMFTYLCKPDTITGHPEPEIALYGNSSATRIITYVMPSNVHQRNQASPVGIFSTVGLYFGEELSEYRFAFNMRNNGLWNSFYRGTTALMFDEDKRRVKLKGQIPQLQILNLKLSDTLLISSKFYTINMIETNYLTGETKLDLTLVGNSRLQQFSTRPINLENTSSTNSIYCTYLKADTGVMASILLAPNSNNVINSVGPLIGSSSDVIETYV